MWRDNQPHGYSRPILFPHSAKRVGDCRQNHHDCRQNIPWLIWNALLTTPYVSEHYKYMFLVARDFYEMFVLYRGKHTTRRSTVGIWSEVRVYRTPATNIPWAGGLRLGKFPHNRRSMCFKNEPPDPKQKVNECCRRLIKHAVPHVALESILRGLRCFWEVLNNWYLSYFLHSPVFKSAG